MEQIHLPDEFLKRMQAQLGPQYPAFLATYALAPKRGMRVNLLKCSVAGFRALSPAPIAESGILEEGFVLSENGLGDEKGLGNQPYHLAGLFYLQEPSAMAAIAQAQVHPGMRVLDLCAAPGGKSGGMAARLAGEGFLLANEIVPNRAKTLAATLERLGVPNAAVSCAKPEAVAEAFPSYFDVTLVDAPCSGEGMFRKDARAALEWSPAHVTACAARQSAILECAAKTVRGGGALVYSTCTFSTEENEGVVERFLAGHPEFALEQMERLYPHTSPGEGHFVARLRRQDETFRPQETLPLKPCAETAYYDGIAELFLQPPQGCAYSLPDGRIMIVRGSLPRGLGKLWVLHVGTFAGEVKKGRFQPAHSLFLAAHGGTYRKKLELPLEDARLSRFLAGEAVACPEDWRGFVPVCAERFPIGFGKAVDGMMKNHLPKGLRVV